MGMYGVEHGWSKIYATIVIYQFFRDFINFQKEKGLLRKIHKERESFSRFVRVRQLRVTHVTFGLTAASLILYRHAFMRLPSANTEDPSVEATDVRQAGFS